MDNEIRIVKITDKKVLNHIPLTTHDTIEFYKQCLEKERVGWEIYYNPQIEEQIHNLIMDNFDIDLQACEWVNCYNNSRKEITNRSALVFAFLDKKNWFVFCKNDYQIKIWNQLKEVVLPYFDSIDAERFFDLFVDERKEIKPSFTRDVIILILDELVEKEYFESASIIKKIVCIHSYKKIENMGEDPQLNEFDIWKYKCTECDKTKVLPEYVMNPELIK